jgi:hypothetical protein
MDELTKYIFDHYNNLLTLEEQAAYKSIFAEFKIKHANSPGMKERLRKTLVSDDPRVVELLAHGPEAFMESVRDRVLHEHRDQVVLIHCPKCGALTKTPRAKQCPKCFFTWHDDV